MPFRSSKINANLTKGSASTADVLRLLRMWEPDESPEEFRDRAIHDNLLGKASRSRAQDLVERVLINRYAPNGRGAPARHIARVAEAGVRREVLDRLLYYHAALAEHLLYMVATELVYDHRRRGVDRIDAADVHRFLHHLAEEGRARRYSESVRDKLAQSTLTALRDFGILEGRAHKRIAPVVAPHEVVGYVVHALRDDGLSAKRIVEHDDWRLFLLHPREAEEAVIEAATHGHFSYRSAGDVRRFDWVHENLTEYVEALAGATHR